MCGTAAGTAAGACAPRSMRAKSCPDSSWNSCRGSNELKERASHRLRTRLVSCRGREAGGWASNWVGRWEAGHVGGRSGEQVGRAAVMGLLRNEAMLPCSPGTCPWQLGRAGRAARHRPHTGTQGTHGMQAGLCLPLLPPPTSRKSDQRASMRVSSLLRSHTARLLSADRGVVPPSAVWL